MLILLATVDCYDIALGPGYDAVQFPLPGLKRLLFFRIIAILVVDLDHALLGMVENRIDHLVHVPHFGKKGCRRAAQILRGELFDAQLVLGDWIDVGI